MPKSMYCGRMYKGVAPDHRRKCCEDAEHAQAGERLAVQQAWSTGLPQCAVRLLEADLAGQSHRPPRIPCGRKRSTTIASAKTIVCAKAWVETRAMIVSAPPMKKAP